MGYRPYKNVDYFIESTPAGAFVGDSLLGFRLNPGQYNITLNSSIQFTTTHNTEGCRVIPVKAKLDSLSAASVHLYGCSFTYGYGVNDDETFAAHLQNELTANKITNHAVMGYGTCQAYLQIKNDNQLKKGDLIVICFSDYHFNRNAMNRQYRQDLKIGFERSIEQVDQLMGGARFPYHELSSTALSFVAWDSMYTNWMGRFYSPGINFFQSHYDNYLDRKIDLVEVTAEVFRMIQRECQQRELKLAILCIDQSTRTDVLHADLSDIFWQDVNFNFKDSSMTHLPHDIHPSASGHRYIFQKAAPFIRSLIHED